MTELERCELAKRKGYTYNPETGDIIGVRGKAIRKKTLGYIHCEIKEKKKQYHLKAHRLAWYLYYGELPKNQIDHIDGDPSNNRINNLRDVTPRQNMFNIKKAKGYSWHKRDKKYAAKIKVNSKNINIGYFITEEEAHNAYLEAKEKYHVIS